MLGARRRFLRLPKPAARWSRLFALATLVGLLGGLAAAAIEWGLHHGTALLVGRFTHLGDPDVLRFEWQVLLMPALGGLVSGVLVHLLCPTAVGHGTDALIRAFHHGGGELPPRGPLVRGAAAVGVISCGGSAGPEGPMAALGASLGSTVGGILRLAPRERRILLIAGCAAGVGAIFRCPLGGALFAASVLYREPEFESPAIVPSFVASVVGYSTFMTLWGGLGRYQYLLDGAERLAFSSAGQLVPYALLGPLCALVSVLFTTSLRFVERLVAGPARLPRWLLPCVGGVGTGGLACLLPQVMDGRYRFIQNALDGFPGAGPPSWGWAALFAAVIVAKCAATALTVGSGGSGGALGPSVFVGGVAGAFLGAVLEGLFPAMFPSDSGLRAALIPVGMGGVLATLMRTPLAAIVMVTEMTGSFGLIVPLMLVCVSAYVLGRAWGLNVEQVRTAAESPAHTGDVIVHVLESCSVGDLAEPRWSETVAPRTPLRDLLPTLQPGTRPLFAVAEGDRLLGLISVSDIRRIMEQPVLAEAVIASDIMVGRLTTLPAPADAYEALAVFRRTNHDVLPVVDGEGRWLGMLTRRHIFDMIRQRLAATQELLAREHADLAAIESEDDLERLIMGVAPARKDIVQRLMVPLDVVGRSLREADFRRAYGAQVVAVIQPDGAIQCPPDLDAPLSAGHRLLAIVDPSGAGPEKR